MIRVTIENLKNPKMNGSVIEWSWGRLDSRRWKIIRNELFFWACHDCDYSQLVAKIEDENGLVESIYAITEHGDIEYSSIYTYLFEGDNYVSEYPAAFDVLTVAD